MITITFIPFPSTTDWQPNPSHQEPTRPCKHGEWIKLEPVETMVSYNVTSLFTCFLNSKRSHPRPDFPPSWISDQTLPISSSMQKHGCTLGSPVSPIMANLYMEEVEHKSTRLTHWYCTQSLVQVQTHR